MVQSPEWRPVTTRILSSHFYKNQEKPLPEDLAEELYGHDIQASVSRMEMFNGCPFTQFLSYGLHLKEREIYRLEAPDIGQLFHAALKMMTDELTQQNRQWADLTKEECDALSTRVVELLAPRLQRQILLSSSRFHYLKRKLRETVSRSAWTLTRHAKASGFSPIGLELPFGPGKDLPPLQFSLPNGRKMEIVGRIDRVDKGITNQGMLLRVIDYKSGVKELNLSEVYYGIALQMLAYLDVVLTNSKKWLGEDAEPAGALYFHVHNPMLNESDKLSDETIEEKLYKQFKMKGLLLEDEEAVRLMDQGLESGDSLVIPVGFKKDGSFMSRSSVASREDFQKLRDHVHSVMKKVGTDITNGIIDISPYKMGGKKPCQFCKFRSVCQFDASLEENQFRILKKEDDAVIYERISEHLIQDNDGKGGTNDGSENSET
jgi:ATP-dependent helicase/nuclease subunit B